MWYKKIAFHMCIFHRPINFQVFHVFLVHELQHRKGEGTKMRLCGNAAATGAQARCGRLQRGARIHAGFVLRGAAQAASLGLDQEWPLAEAPWLEPGCQNSASADWHAQHRSGSAFGRGLHVHLPCCLLRKRSHPERLRAFHL